LRCRVPVSTSKVQGLTSANAQLTLDLEHWTLDLPSLSGMLILIRAKRNKVSRYAYLLRNSVGEDG